jgi:hypothetical protein
MFQASKATLATTMATAAIPVVMYGGVAFFAFTDRLVSVHDVLELIPQPATPGSFLVRFFDFRDINAQILSI